MHTDRILDTHLSINGIATRNNMEQPSVTGNLNVLGTGKHPFQVITAHQSVTMGNCHHTPIIHRAYVPAGYPNIGRFHLIAASLLCFPHRLTD